MPRIGLLRIPHRAGRNVGSLAVPGAAWRRQGSGDALARLIAQIGARFNVQVSQKGGRDDGADRAAPLAGALLNTLFINHFQDMGARTISR